MLYTCEKCGQQYQIEEPGSYQCQCGVIFSISMPDQSTPTTPIKPGEIKTNVKQGALIGSAVCLLLGIAFQSISNFLIILYVPLYIAAFILSIIAMAQKRVGGGILCLLATLIFPLIIFFANIAQWAEEKSQSIENIIESQNSVPRQSQTKLPKSSSTVRRSTVVPQTIPTVVEKPELTGLCGVTFGTVFNPKGVKKQGTLTSGEPYYVISLKKYFMNFKDVLVLITPKSKKIYSIWISKDCKNSEEARAEYKKVIAVLEKHYGKKSQRPYFTVDPMGEIDFNNGTILVKTNLNFSSNSIEIRATDKKLSTLAEEEKKQLAIETIDTSVL